VFAAVFRVGPAVPRGSEISSFHGQTVSSCCRGVIRPSGSAVYPHQLHSHALSKVDSTAYLINVVQGSSGTEDPGPLVSRNNIYWITFFVLCRHCQSHFGLILPSRSTVPLLCKLIGRAEASKRDFTTQKIPLRLAETLFLAQGYTMVPLMISICENVRFKEIRLCSQNHKISHETYSLVTRSGRVWGVRELV
jgi:hypothetical protein